MRACAQRDAGRLLLLLVLPGGLIGRRCARLGRAKRAPHLHDTCAWRAPQFIMGLTGSTASVVLAYLMPALTLLCLMDNCPELNSCLKVTALAWRFRARSRSVRRKCHGVAQPHLPLQRAASLPVHCVVWEVRCGERDGTRGRWRRGGGGGGVAAQTPGAMILPRDMRLQWEWRRRGAFVLLAFGVVTGVVRARRPLPDLCGRLCSCPGVMRRHGVPA